MPTFEKYVCFYPLMQAQHYLLYHLHSFGLFRTECTELHHRQSMNGLISRKDFTSYKKIKLNKNKKKSPYCMLANQNMYKSTLSK